MSKNEPITMQRIETTLNEVLSLVNELVAVSRRSIVTKSAYTPAEVADILNKSPYTIREWCRLGRVAAKKRQGGRGNEAEWEISHQELERVRSHGLLAVKQRK